MSGKNPSSVIDRAETGDRQLFQPPPDFARQANVNSEAIYAQADADYEAFWEDWAKQLSWFKGWDTVLEWEPPFARWFVGGKLNASYNCLDRHVVAERGSKIAYYWEGEDGSRRTATYAQLLAKVERFASVLKRLGVGKGDVVGIFLPMLLELPVAMLACARIGAVHNVVFGGFAAAAMAERMQVSEAKLLVTVDHSIRRGKSMAIKEEVDQVIATCSSVEHVVVVRRTDLKTPMQPGRDLWWHEAMALESSRCPAIELDSEDPLFILYTSGSTAKPKGILHTTGGYLTGVCATQQLVFDLKDEDLYWCSADCGWITGHSYVVYGPLLCGATSVIYKGALDYPDKDRWWDIIERYRVSILYTAPTAIRACMKWGEGYPQSHDLSSLRLLGSVGEPINPKAWLWYHDVIGGGNCPIVDTWWQTETGAIMIAPLPGVTATKPGSAVRPFPGIKAAVVDASGDEVQEGTGQLVILRPWPAMFRGIYKDEQRYRSTYWSSYGCDVYVTGDAARVDGDGYFWIMGRTDDVVNVSGHRLSTMEVESALVLHPLDSRPHALSTLPV